MSWVYRCVKGGQESNLLTEVSGQKVFHSRWLKLQQFWVNKQGQKPSNTDIMVPLAGAHSNRHVQAQIAHLHSLLDGVEQP